MHGERSIERETQPIASPGAGSLSRTEAQRDTYVRRWDLVSPSATQIGRAETPAGDVSDRMRRLHEERHPAMEGHSERAHRLDKLRVAHALCNRLELTPWQRDRVLGIMERLDLTAFGSQRSIPKVALVTIRHVVDVERRRYLGLEDGERIRESSPEELEELYERFQSIKDDQGFRFLLDQHGLDTTSLNRLRRVLKDQLETQGIGEAALGRDPDRDPHLPEAATGGAAETDGGE